jgi:hypothetical protein
VAQTKRKRKHRGNAAGMVEARGRTGRKPTEEERDLTKAAGGKPKRVSPMDREPTWRGSTNRAVIAAVVFMAAVILLFKQPIAGAVSLGAVMFFLYIPMGYYTDRFLWRRRQAKKAQT